MEVCFQDNGRPVRAHAVRDAQVSEDTPLRSGAHAAREFAQLSGGEDHVSPRFAQPSQAASDVLASCPHGMGRQSLMTSRPAFAFHGCAM